MRWKNIWLTQSRYTVQKEAAICHVFRENEHYDNAAVKARDRRKEKICQTYNLQLIRVENSYARRYNHIKEILVNYFSRMH